MRARKYTQVDSLYSHTFGWFYDVRGMDDLFLYSSRGRHRNNHKLEKSTFFAKNVPFFRFCPKFLSPMSLSLFFCNLMEKTASKSVNNFSSYNKETIKS